MSETDDTDDLLLIPPDSFSSTLDLHETPIYDIVGSLLTEVVRLESRLDSLSPHTSAEMLNRSGRLPLRKFSSHEDIPQRQPSSTQSTPQKPRKQLGVLSLPNSPNIDRPGRPLRRSNEGDTYATRPIHQNGPTKPEVAPLGEIDHFISNVKLIKRLNAVRNLDSDFSSMEVLSSQTRHLDMEQVDEMLREMELQQRERELRLAATEQEVFKRPPERPCAKRSAWTAESRGLRAFGELRPADEPFSRSSARHSTDNESNNAAASDSDSEPTQSTAYEKASKLYDLDKNYNLGLVSLANIWTANTGDCPEMPIKYEQKIKEERMRRQHCEQTIQELQNRVLELQERIAVAVQVDEAKDKAILRFHASWEKSDSKLHQIEAENEKFKEEITKLEKSIIENSTEYQNKLELYEQETTKALRVAHSTQDKLIEIEERCTELQNEKRIIQVNSEEFQKKYLTEFEKNKLFPEILAQKELELSENRTSLVDARKEISESKIAVENCQKEFFAMKVENETLLAKFESGQKELNEILNQKTKLTKEIETHKIAAKSFEAELRKMRDQLDANKIELKNYYQGQVELLVQNKLKEFQNQLDDAEKKLKGDLGKKEVTIAKTAAYHIQQISEKHALEIKLIEEKHEEESRLYKVQLSQLQREIDESNHKLKRQSEKHLLIERQLHKFMESLKQDTSIEDLTSIKSKSFNNLEEFLSLNIRSDENKIKKDDGKSATAFHTCDTPVTTRVEKGTKRKDAGRDNNLQDTIEMLLEKRADMTEEANSQIFNDGLLAFYQKISKDMKGKQPWK